MENTRKMILGASSIYHNSFIGHLGAHGFFDSLILIICRRHRQAAWKANYHGIIMYSFFL